MRNAYALRPNETDEHPNATGCSYCGENYVPGDVVVDGSSVYGQDYKSTHVECFREIPQNRLAADHEARYGARYAVDYRN